MLEIIPLARIWSSAEAAAEGFDFVVDGHVRVPARQVRESAAAELAAERLVGRLRVTSGHVRLQVRSALEHEPAMRTLERSVDVSSTQVIFQTI